MIPDAELPADHREALDRCARLKVLLAEMEVNDPTGTFTLEDIFKRTLNQVESLVRHHGWMEVIERNEQKIERWPLRAWPEMTEVLNPEEGSI